MASSYLPVLAYSIARPYRANALFGSWATIARRASSLSIGRKLSARKRVLPCACGVPVFQAGGAIRARVVAARAALAARRRVARIVRSERARAVARRADAARSVQCRLRPAV